MQFSGKCSNPSLRLVLLMTNVSSLFKSLRGFKLPPKGQLLMSKSFSSSNEAKISKSRTAIFWLLFRQSFFRLLRGLRKFKSLNSLLPHLSSVSSGQSVKSKSVNWLFEQLNFSKLVNPFNHNPPFNFIFLFSFFSYWLISS